MSSLAGLRWLLPDALFRAAGFAETVQDPEVGRARAALPQWPVSDGPASRALDAWVRPRLPAALVCCGREDYGNAPHTAASVRYRDPTGGHVRVVRRHLARPLLLDALSGVRHDAAVRIPPTGTDVIRIDDDGTRRLLMVRPGGTLLLVEATGATGSGTPLSGEQLDRLAVALDEPTADLDEHAG